MVTSSVKLPQIYKYKVFQYQVSLMLNTGTKNHLAGDKKGESETIILQISEDNETISRTKKNLPSHRIESSRNLFFLRRAENHRPAAGTEEQVAVRMGAEGAESQRLVELRIDIFEDSREAAELLKGIAL